MAFRIDIVTLFPEIFQSFLDTSLIGKANKLGQIEISFINPRDFTHDPHRTVDDNPYGGGQGMVLKAPPFVAAIKHAKQSSVAHEACRTVLMCPQGQPLNQVKLNRLSDCKHLVLVCGRYEGFDERIRGAVDEEISLGDYVLNGGEVAAMALIEGVGRLLPDVIGKAESFKDESHMSTLLEFPQFTRPQCFEGQTVPDVLLSGNHAAIDAWRESQRISRTRERRPDLWRKARQIVSESKESEIFVSLIHYPVLDKEGCETTTSVTNLDIHDISRSCCTYDIKQFFIVTPLIAQQQLVQKIISHWSVGSHSKDQRGRSEALDLARVCPSLLDVTKTITERCGAEPFIVSTTAVESNDQLGVNGILSSWPNDRPMLLLFGTGYGLASSLTQQSDAIMSPIGGGGTYNHLSVRSAVAIVLDRLLGMRE